MSPLKTTLLPSLALIIAAFIVSFSLSAENEKNLISVEGGTVDLGRIHSETVVSTISLKTQDTGQSLYEDTFQTANIGARNRQNMASQLDEWNMERDPDDQLSLDTASMNRPSVLNISVSIHYRSEHFPSYELVIEEFEEELAANHPMAAVAARVEEFEKTIKPSIQQSLHF